MKSKNSLTTTHHRNEITIRRRRAEDHGTIGTLDKLIKGELKLDRSATELTAGNESMREEKIGDLYAVHDHHIIELFLDSIKFFHIFTS
jgi:hypothetical protein